MMVDHTQVRTPRNIGEGCQLIAQDSRHAMAADNTSPSFAVCFLSPLEALRKSCTPPPTPACSGAGTRAC